MHYSSLFKKGSRRGETEQSVNQATGGDPYQPHDSTYTQPPAQQPTAVPQAIGGFPFQPYGSAYTPSPTIRAFSSQPDGTTYTQSPAQRPTPPPPLPPREQRTMEANLFPTSVAAVSQGPRQPTQGHGPLLQQPSPQRLTSLSPPIAGAQRTPSPQGYQTFQPSWSNSSVTLRRSPSPAQYPALQASAPSPRPSPGPLPSQPPATKRDPPKVRKILSLDGGGVRGLSIIKILKYIMQELNRERGLESAPLDPWQEFDMIGGTSTGGIIAIMLGRLHLTLDECESAYSLLSETIFTPVHNPANPLRVYRFLNAQGKFSSTPLEDCIKSTIWSKQLSEDALLKNQDGDACRVFVCATRAEDHSLAILRSYKTRRHDPLFNICKIWEAARATSAASTFFEPIEIGPSRQNFVDGALTGKNNPIRSANTESRDIWPGEDRLILSIGTGAAPGQAVTGNLVSLATRIKEIVVDSEQTDRDFRMENNEMVRNGRLYRFNVMHGLADVGLEEHQAVNRIATYTDRYLDHPDVFDMVQACVNNLVLGGQRLGIRPEEGLFVM